MRTNYFYSTEGLDTFQLGTRHRFFIYDVDIFKFKKATKNQLDKYWSVIEDVPPEDFVSTKHYRSNRYYEGVVVSRHKALDANDHDRITVMFRTVRGSRTVECEVGLVKNTYYGYPEGVKRNIEKYEEHKRGFIKSVIELDKQQLVDYFKLIYKPMSAGGEFLTDSEYNNMRNEIRELIRINPDIDPRLVRAASPLYFFDYMNYYQLAEILCKYVNTQIGTAKEIADKLYKKGLEAAKEVPIYTSLFPGF